MDLTLEGQVYYAASPYMIGFFETTWMKRGNLDRKKLASLFQQYTFPHFWDANWGHGEKMTTFRVLPAEGAFADEYVEVLDYEKVTSIVERSEHFSLAMCSCRHELEHEGNRACACKTPLELCAIMGTSAETVVRHGFGREVSKTEMLEHFSRAREMGLVFNADNVQCGLRFICSCCGCCCNVLRGVRRGYANSIVSSNYIAQVSPEACSGCGLCTKKCPVEAIQAVADVTPLAGRRACSEVIEARCIGCGVCATKCKTGAIKLHPRQQRVFTPETIFERIILQTLERGNLQNTLFDGSKISHAFLRGFVGGFLKLPAVKRTLVSEALRSRFLAFMRKGAPSYLRRRTPSSV
jgi:ferredoxin